MASDALRQPLYHPLVVLGDMHATLNYPEAVRYADFVLLGDGDESIVEFVEELENLSSTPLPICGVWPADGAPLNIRGIAYLRSGGDDTAEPFTTEERPQPFNIETIPDRSLVFDYARMAKKYDTLWPQAHASRGCAGTCDYCCVIAHFGRRVRTRSPEVVVEDIRQAISFHNRSFPPRLSRAVWLTDDNFAQDRQWAKSVLQAIIASDLSWPIPRTFAFRACPSEKASCHGWKFTAEDARLAARAIALSSLHDKFKPIHLAIIRRLDGKAAADDYIARNLDSPAIRQVAYDATMRRKDYAEDQHSTRRSAPCL